MTLARISFTSFTLGLALAAGSIGTSTAATVEPGTGLALGAKLPSATTKMKNVDGKMVAIADIKGKAGTLVVFTCNHCPFAKGWEERIVELGNTYAKKGVGVILVNANDPTLHEEDGYVQ